MAVLLNLAIGALSRAGPVNLAALPAHRAKLMLFGQFVGSWDLDILAHQPDGTARRFTGEWHFGWVLEGRAVQDVLITRPTADRETAGATQGGIGSTLRVYDPGMDAWWVVWAGPVDRECGLPSALGRPVRAAR